MLDVAGHVPYVLSLVRNTHHDLLHCACMHPLECPILSCYAWYHTVCDTRNTVEPSTYD
jgi:hypothetical protein